MSGSDQPSWRRPVAVAVAFFVLGVVLTWLGVNDWRVFPESDDQSGSGATEQSNSPATKPSAGTTATPTDSEPSVRPEPSLGLPSVQLQLDPRSVDDFDGQSDLVIRAHVASNLAPGSRVQFRLHSAPGLTGAEYSSERRISETGEANSTIRISPCSLLDLNRQVASEAEGDYVIVVQDMRSGVKARATTSLGLAPGADEFRDWQGGACVLY
jgi:hypothetical protein